MRLGAQFYTLRTHTQTPEGIRETFRRVKEIGYDAVQISAIGKDIPASLLAELSREYGLPITCTHTSFDRIVNDTDRVIEEHKLFGCTEIGLGAMNGEFRGSKENLERFIATLAPAVEKIRAAGLTFGYHNHAFEFDPLSDADGVGFDVLVEKTDWNFILDTYWVAYAGGDPVDFIRRLKGRVLNLHFKDMKTSPKGEICPVGQGVLDFGAIVAAAEETGISYGLVEQDNAPDLATAERDEFAQMAESYAHLRPLIPSVR